MRGRIAVAADGVGQGSRVSPPEEQPADGGALRSTFARFLVVGGVSYVVNQVLLFALYEGGLHSMAAIGTPLGAFDAGLLLASVLALETSILVRFGLNDRWTFATCHAKPFRRRLVESNLSSLAAPAICLAAVNLLTPVLGISYLVANSIGIAAGLVWNWVWSSRVVWRPADALAGKVGRLR